MKIIASVAEINYSRISVNLTSPKPGGPEGIFQTRNAKCMRHGKYVADLLFSGPKVTPITGINPLLFYKQSSMSLRFLNGDVIDGPEFRIDDVLNGTDTVTNEGYHIFMGNYSENIKKSNTFGRKFVCHITIKGDKFIFDFGKKSPLKR